MSTGPKIQMPPAASPMHDVIMDAEGRITGMNNRQDWMAFLHSLQQQSFCASRNGTTAQRPTNAVDGRYIGMPYFDTTVGKPIFLKSVNPDVWIDAAGNTV